MSESVNRKHLRLYLPEWMYEDIKVSAEGAGVSMNAWVKMLIAKELATARLLTSEELEEAALPPITFGKGGK